MNPSINDIDFLLEKLSESSVSRHLQTTEDNIIYDKNITEKLSNISIKQFRYILHCLHTKKMRKAIDILKTIGIKFKEFKN